MTSPQTDSAAPDALFVIHRLTDESRLVTICRQQPHRLVLILSTHRPFPHEQRALAVRIHPTQARFLSFCDVLDDSIMAAIDDETTRELRTQRTPATGYVRAFQIRMTAKKNAVVFQHLPRLGPGARLYADAGLGLSWAFWQQKGAVSFGRYSLQRKYSDHPWVLAWSRWRLGRRAPKTAVWVSDGNVRYLLAGRINRLPLRPDINPIPAAFNQRNAAHADFIAVSLHDYLPAIHHYGRPIRIIADGYLPSNYPRSYLDSYGPAEFVTTDPFSALWLRMHDRVVAATPAFLTPGPWKTITQPVNIRTVVCLLNHTGDWSALINRSDTDDLAVMITEAAATNPNLSFVLRPHPGMEHTDHEGPGGMQRLAQLVHQSQLSNLIYSTATLEEDLVRGDFFVSEYSATLLDAWRLGKAGMILNATGRRSFMEDFARLGFFNADGATSFGQILKVLQSGTEDFIHQHNAAIARYNERLAAHLVP